MNSMESGKYLVVSVHPYEEVTPDSHPRRLEEAAESNGVDCLALRYGDSPGDQSTVLQEEADPSRRGNYKLPDEASEMYEKVVVCGGDAAECVARFARTNSDVVAGCWLEETYTRTGEGIEEVDGILEKDPGEVRAFAFLGLEPMNPLEGGEAV